MSANEALLPVRALYHAVELDNATPPYDRVQLKVYYPAAFGNSTEEQNTGVIPARDSESPFPIVIIMPGINVGPESYNWLAQSLAITGLVVVCFSLIAEAMPGVISLTPGIELSALMPDTYGKQTSSTSLPSLRRALMALDQQGVLAGRLDLESIIIGGHSAGGSVALFNAEPDWCPGLKACFSYATHSGAATTLGWPEQTILALPGKLPTLIMGGSRDGVIASSAHRYGAKTGDPVASIQKTFEQGLSSQRNDSYLAIIDGANHFSMAHPHDDTTGRSFLDWEIRRDAAETRQLISSLLIDFINLHVKSKCNRQDFLQDYLNREVLTLGLCR